MLRKLIAAAVLIAASTSTFAAPHFFLQLKNGTNKNITISVKENVGKMHLEPQLVDNTPLAAQQSSEKYGVVFEPLTAEGMFDVVFTGQKACTFTIGYFAPGNPKITVMGHGCNGGGYQIIDNGHTLLLYVSDIHLGNSKV